MSVRVKPRRRRQKYLICRDCKQRESNVTAHNRMCGRCWPCHKKDPCIMEDESL